MTRLLIGDLHLTDRPRDAYRFGIFKWIRKQQERVKPSLTILMGDLTDKKDRHSSVLVNRIVDELSDLGNIVMLMGNHDYVDENNPFFKFLGSSFIHEPTQINRSLFLPHMRKEATFANVCKSFSGAKIDYVFTHQTFEGAIAETGARLSGFSQAHIEALKPRLGVYAGDVHKPQRSGQITYVGAPYQVRFGDNYDPRCIVLDDDGLAVDLFFDTVRKWNLTIRSPDDITKNKHLYKGDQIKIAVELVREEAVEWKAHRQQVMQAAQAKGLEVFGIDCVVQSSTSKKAKLTEVKKRTDEDIMTAYCNYENVSHQIREMGQTLLNVQHKDDTP